MNLKIAADYNSGHYIQDSSYIQQNGDQKLQTNRMRTGAFYPDLLHSLQLKLQKQVLQEGFYSS